MNDFSAPTLPNSLMVPWQERWNNVQRLIHEGALQDAYRYLLELRRDLDGVSDMEYLRYDVNQQCFEIGWSLTGDPVVFQYGEAAARTTTDSRRAAPIYHNLSLYSLQKGMIAEAESYLAKCREHALHPADKAAMYHLEGRIYYANKDYDSAFTSFMQAEEYAERAHLDMRKVYVIINAADALYAKGLHQTAISELNRAEQIAKDLHNLVIMMRCMVRKAQLYIKMGLNTDAQRVIEQIPLQMD